jgi:hypothetical protein
MMVSSVKSIPAMQVLLEHKKLPAGEPVII